MKGLTRTFIGAGEGKPGREKKRMQGSVLLCRAQRDIEERKGGSHAKLVKARIVGIDCMMSIRRYFI